VEYWNWRGVIGMSVKIFISYRRNENAWHAGRIKDWLEREFGDDLIFMDVDGIAAGNDFKQDLTKAVSQCRAMLVIIGLNWSNVAGPNGARRLDSPSDFVRIEIAAALRRDIRVIPILIDDAVLPTNEQLPDDLEKLADRHSIDIRHRSFESDMRRLIKDLKNSGVHSSNRNILGWPKHSSLNELGKALWGAFFGRFIAFCISILLPLPKSGLQLLFSFYLSSALLVIFTFGLFLLYI
jgi:TIR domain